MRKSKAKRRKGLKELGNKKSKTAYNAEALEFFKKTLERVRQPGEKSAKSFRAINMGGLQKAVQALPKKDREIVEKFWGLTGGPNHSKKMLRRDTKDVAYNEMCSKAIVSARKLLSLDYVIIFDDSVKGLIRLIGKKVNKNRINISDIDCAKLLMGFFIYIDNGPKMSFETMPMSIDTKLNGSFWFDEYEVLEQMSQEVEKYPDNSINLKLLISIFETMDFNDMLSIKKSMSIEINNYFKNLQVITMNVGIETVKDFTSEDVEIVRTVSSIRELKERVFPYGAWDVTSALILGNHDGKINLSEFYAILNTIRNDWSKIADFKTGHKELRVYNGIRTLNIYSIGGLEFTDIAEVMFLYSECNVI